MTHPYIRYLAAWDLEEAGFHAELDRLAGRPVRFSGVPRPCATVDACLRAFTSDPMAAVTEAPDGTLLLPGNPHQVLRELLHRRGTSKKGLFGTRSGGPRGCGSLGWPDEARVDDYRRALYRGLVDEALTRDDPQRAHLEAAPWPDRRRYALCVTYEVDTRDAMQQVNAVVEEDLAHGAVPTLFVAPELLGAKALRGAVEAGAEVGLLATEAHHLRPARIRRQLRRRSKDMEELQVRGMRGAPWALSGQRLDELRQVTRYSCSMPDTVPCPGRGGHRGCAITTPFRREGILEVPITVAPQEMLLDGGWQGLDLMDLIRTKIMAIRERYTVAVVSIRMAPDRGTSRVQRDLLGAILGETAEPGDVWFTTPGRVAEHWMDAR